MTVGYVISQDHTNYAMYTESLQRKTLLTIYV